MEVRTVKQHIKDKKFDKFYIFTGPEIQLQNIYINKIAEVAGLVVSRLDSVVDLYKSKRGASLVNNRYCYVIRDDKDFMKNEAAWNSIERMIGDNLLILLYTQIDKRNKFYKHYKDKQVVFEYLEPAVLVKYIKKELDLSDTKALRLAEICENDYARILLEIDKIKTFKAAYKAQKLSDEEALDRLLKDGDIYQPPKDAVFDFVAKVLDRTPKSAFQLLEECKEVGEAPLIMQSVMYTQFKHLLQYQSCASKDISVSTGLTGWDIKLVKDKKDNYRTGELVWILRFLRSLEKGIKIGEIEPDMCMDYTLVNIL